MKNPLYLLLVITIFCALVLAACGGGGSAPQPAGGGAKADRPAPPAEYANKTNPKTGDAEAAKAGQALYQTNCASCHGEKGKGDGPAAASLNPKPQDLLDNQAGLSDAYLFWRISEGGAMAPFNSVMPAWKAMLSEDQIWQVITHIRAMK